jgi:NAD(P)H-hydrate epimerase
MVLQIREDLERVVVTAQQMREIEESIFAAGMPVPALMEKAALLSAMRIKNIYPVDSFLQVGIVIGPGHNGGDALVVARELHLSGFMVLLYSPFDQFKNLTTQHFNYALSLGINRVDNINLLEKCALIIDGLFGFGNERNLTGNIATVIEKINTWSQPKVSIDIPSGIHTDTGAVLGIAIKATRTLCLGLWKRAFFQDAALPYLGEVERIDFGIPVGYVSTILGKTPSVQKLDRELAKSFLPLPRPVITHKYRQGHLLLICGSRRYAGGAILTALGARASGVGMVSIAVPESLKYLLVSHLPEALIVECPENETGAIAKLSPLIRDFSQFDAIVCGPGLTLQGSNFIEELLEVPCPLVLDADGLNIIARKNALGIIAVRQEATILTPHEGEFKRLFPDIELEDRLNAVQKAARQSKATILLKGARTAIANPEGAIWIVPESTPALARGGSGDVLAGLLGGTIAQSGNRLLHDLVATAAWWHARAAIAAAKERTELGVDPLTLSQYLVLSIF